MKVKASLHCHTSADLVEGGVIGYSVFELIDRAKEAGIRVLAHTCHRYFVWDQAWSDYADQNDILLIPGAELELAEDGSANHTLAINCDASISEVQSFADLAHYRSTHPDLLVIAAHPNFGFGVSLGKERLLKYWSLFDAVEHSWFYSRFLNPNQLIGQLCSTRHKPFIATADLHNFNFSCLRSDYAVLELAELSIANVIKTIRKGDFTNVSEPKSLFQLGSTISHALYLDYLNKLTKKQ
jgi:predicted metal-dependent phosphoesterase TrpH